ncbi:glycosyltransferase [Nocardioides flavus (ex Wang et al. 2016)]|uniref:glycosyltransferase n=1 Tax=Nocardioides flavus (ex Wang et al. 2016) TaxID=2058780 RepID=UPI00174ECCC5|nr:glycosyltransferase [Nocardioides flavus (ex Wang et al. 2016)]
MDVAVFAPGLLAGGGAEKTALSVAAALSDLGLSVVCFTDRPIDSGWLDEHFGLAIGDVHFSVLPPSVRARIRAPRALLDLWEDLRILRAVKRVRPRLFVNVKFKSSLPGAGTVNWYFTHFPHALEVSPRSAPHSAYLRLTAWARRLLLHRQNGSFIETYDLVTANSKFTGEHVAERWGVVAETMYPPCDLTPGTEAAQPRDRIILAVGRFQGRDEGVPHKNQHVMVDAFSELEDLIAAGWELHLVGAAHGHEAETYLDEVRSMASGLPVLIHPNASQSELADLRRRASLYWHAQGYDTDVRTRPEAQEHFGISTVEAMAAGAIPLVYATAGPQEIVAPLNPDWTWETLAELRLMTRSVAFATDTASHRAACVRRAADFGEDAFREQVRDVWKRLCAGHARETS